MHKCTTNNKNNIKMTTLITRLNKIYKATHRRRCLINMIALLAIDKENRQYKLLKESDVKECIRNKNVYTCERNFSTYRVGTHVPCKVKIYSQTPEQLTHCEKQNIKISI